MFRKSCLICDSSNLKEILNLGMHPFADTFIPEKNLSDPDKAYPLICDLCLDCGGIQLRCITNPKDRYCGVDYSYTSSNSNFSRVHWQDYAQEVIKKLDLEKEGFVIEIGSNDGFLAEQFVLQGYRAIGVDPSPYMAELAKKRGIETITELFSQTIGDSILEKFEKADLIIANNVFNHSENPLDFAKAVSNLLNEDGSFVFELPYWGSSMESRKFDQIYHEHVSYFTAKSSAKIMENAGMYISSIEIVNYHGGSLRVYAKKRKNSENHCEELNTLIQKENNLDLFETKKYNLFMENLIYQRNKFLKSLYSLKENGENIIAVGAAAKGNTFLNFYQLDKSIIDFVTDSSPHKKEKYTPLTRIPIVGDQIFEKYLDKKVYALILSWNLADILKPILSKINPNIKFISPEKQ